MIGTTRLCALVLGLTAAACQSEVPVKQEVPRPAPVYVVGEPPGRLPVQFPGTIQASRTADLSLRVGGPLIELPAQEGMAVKKGDLLAQIDPRDFRVQVRASSSRLQAAKAQWEHAQLRHRRLRELIRHKAAPQAEFDAAFAELGVAAAEVEQAKRALEAARLALRDTSLRSPMDGRVALVRIDNHQTVQPGQPVIQIQGSDALEIRVDVPERELLTLVRTPSPDLSVVFELEGVAPRSAHIQEYATSIDPETKTYGVTLLIETSMPIAILPGMTATVQWIRPPSSGHLTIPLKSVTTNAGGQTQVFRLDEEDRLVPTDVSLGSLSTAAVTVLAGLDPGDRILAAGVRSAQAGQRVRPLDDRKGPAGRIPSEMSLAGPVIEGS